MATLDVLSAFLWGADKLSINEGDGVVRPRIILAAATDPRTVRVVFDREMGFQPVFGTVLNASLYSITDGDGYALPVLRVHQADAVSVNLVTVTQEDKTYDLQASTEILDAYGAALDPAYNETQFAGIPQNYQSYEDGYFFLGLDAGLQTESGPLPDPDYDPPVLQNQDPLPNEIEVPATDNIIFEIVDAGSGVNAASVVIKIEGVTAWTGRTSQPGFSVSEIPIVDGYRYIVDPDANLPSFQWITVGVYAEDLNPSGPPTPNVLDTSYRFKTEDPNAPFLTDLSPAEGSSGNPRDGYVELAVVDLEGMVDGSTIRIDINGSLAFDADSFDLFYPPFDGAASAILQGVFDGYDGYGILLERTSDFSSYELVEVRVRAQDYGGNPLDRTYSFRIEDYTGPSFTNISPTPYSDNNARTARVEFDIYDPGTGVDLTSLRVYIDGNTAYDGYGFLPPYDGYGSEVTGPFLIDGYDGYHVAVQPTSDYPSGGTVYVDVIITDEEGN